MSTEHITELSAYDHAVGALIAKAYDAAKGDDRVPSDFGRFLARSPKEQIMRSQADSAKSFITELAGSADRGIEKMFKNRKIGLPMIYYYRTIGLTPAESAEAAGFHHDMVASTDAGDKHWQLSMANVDLEYNMTLVATDKACLDRMQLAWFFHASNMRQGNQKLRVTFRIGDMEETLAGEVLDPRGEAVTFIDTSEGKLSGRLVTSTVTFRVRAQVIHGKGYEFVTPRWVFEMAEPFGYSRNAKRQENQI